MRRLWLRVCTVCVVGCGLAAVVLGCGGAVFWVVVSWSVGVWLCVFDVWLCGLYGPLPEKGATCGLT